MGGAGTRDRVADTALRLFNEWGTAAVSTNRIAGDAGISPGNLYYHFRNKEEVIRAIFERVDAHWDESYALPEGEEPTIPDVRDMVERTFSGLWEYRFFYRELGALVRRDPELASRFRRLRERGLVGTEALLRGFIGVGVMSGIEDDTALPRLAGTLMLVAEFWLPFEETGPGEYEPVSEGAAVMMQLLEPYLVGGDRASVIGERDMDGGGES